MKLLIDYPGYQPLGDLFSDLTLLLNDPRQEIRLDVHRNVLAWQIPYFMTSLSFRQRQADKKREITLLVDDAETARLFFLSFYGYKTEWNTRQFLQVIKLKSYLGLDINLEELYWLKIGPEDFPFFLQVINLPEIEIDRRLLRTIKRNLPPDFSWQGVDEDFKAAVLENRDIRLFSASSDLTIKEWDLDYPDDQGGGHCVRTFTGHTDCVRSIVLSADRRRLYSASVDRTIKEWDLGDNQDNQDNQGSDHCLRTFSGHTNWVTSLVLSADQQRLFSASYDKTIKEWNLGSGHCVRTFTGHTDYINSIVLSADQQRLFSASDDRTIKEWNLNDNQGGSVQCMRTFTGHTSWVRSIILSADQQRLFSASIDRTIKEWDLDNQGSGHCVRTFIGHTGDIRSMVLSADQQRLFSAGNDLTIKEWDLDNQGSRGRCVRTFIGHTDLVRSIILSADQQRLFSASFDKTIKEWDLNYQGSSGHCVRTLTGHKNGVLSIVLK